MQIDSESQVCARRYALVRICLRGVSGALSLAGLALLGPAGLATVLRDATSGLAWPLQVAVFFATLGVAAFLLTLPLTYYRAFVLPHRYGLSNQTTRGWLADLLKGAAIGAVLGGLSTEVLYALLRLNPDWWWVWAAIAYALLSVVLTLVAPVVILPFFFRLRPLRNHALRAAISGLAARAGAQVAEVCEINLSGKTRAANAAVVGLGLTRKIVLGDTLLDEFPPEEIEVVVAHELGHHVHRDLAKGILLGACLSVFGFGITAGVLKLAAARWHFAGVWDLGAFPALAASLGIWRAASSVTERAFTRKMEAAADAYSLELTGLGASFVASEVRLVNQNLAWLRPPRIVELLFYTHPAPWRRIAMGEAYSAQRDALGGISQVRRPSTE